MRAFYHFLLTIFLFFACFNSHAQNITATIGSPSSCLNVGDTLVVPITASMASGISTSAISLAIDYDSTKLQCINSVTGLNSAISSGFLSICGLYSNLYPNAPFNATTRRQFRAGWYALTPVTVNGLLFNLRFRVLATGNTTIKWDQATPGIAEFADQFADVIPNVSWVNSTLSIAPNPSALLSQPTGNSAISIGSSTSFSVSASPGSVFQWQVLGSNGNWNNLSNVPPYNGVNSSTLSITNAPMSLDSSRYRVVLAGCSNVFSNTVLLLVKPGIGIPQINSCIGDTVNIPLNNFNLNGVANAFLTLQYNPDSLVYVGFSNLNPVLNGMSITGGGGSVVMNWNAASNQNMPSGTLLQLRFRVNGNSNLTWDTVVTPCEFNDENLNLVPQTYVSGSVTQSTKRFTWNRNICEGQSFSLSGQSYTTSGTYQGRRIGTGGACDTLITLNLNVIPRQTILPAVTRCFNQPYAFNGLSLTSSGTYYDTLVNSLGCDSILRLDLVVNPTYNQTQNLVICLGSSFAFGGQSLNTSGTYTNLFTTQSGCDSFVQLNLSVANSIAIQSVNNSNGFCPGGTVRIGLPSPVAGAIYKWKFNGNLVVGAQSDTLLVNQAGDYVMEAQFSPTCTLLSNTLTISVLNCNRITGDLRYDNTNQTPLAGVPVLLKTLLGNVVMRDTTDSSGCYDMAGYANGIYLLDASVNYAWGGVTSADALLVTRAFNALVSLTPLRIKAGDVNANNIANSADALLINRRITGLLAAFSAGTFINNLPTVNATGNPLQANLRALSTGDVNGSYSVPSAVPSLVLDTVFGNGNVGTAVVRFTNPGAGVFERGVVWSTSPNPTISSSKSVAGSGGFGFTHNFPLTYTNNIQYARAYARTSAGVYYSNEKTFTPVPGQPCPGVSTVADIDGNIYQGIQIGTQCWTQSNLKTSKFRNGDNIPTGLSNSSWQNTTSGAYAIYNNNPVNDSLYGKLYNHYAVTDSRGLCPTGWHVPSESEWKVLVKFLDPNSDTNSVNNPLSTTAGGALKSTATQPTVTGWLSPNGGATNVSGFTALPSGLRFDTGNFQYLISNGYWWSSAIPSVNSARSSDLNATMGNINRSNYHRSHGFSVRCLINTLPQVNTTSVTNLTPSNALVTGEVISDGGDQNTTRGFCYSTTPSPTISNDTTMNGTGLGVYSDTLQNLIPSTTYYVRAYATNSVGTSYGNEVSFTTTAMQSFTCGTSTVSDIDNNTYNTVQIGAQCWTKSNLKTSKYRNGDNIPTGLSNSAWQNTTSGAYAIYNNNPVNDGLYGKLYNHYAVTDSRGLCPTGWHVPSDSEWTILENQLGGSSVAGGSLKSTATQPTPSGWNPPNTGATNSSGFTALPGGLRASDGGFYNLANYGIWWSSSFLSWSDAWERNMGYNYSSIGRTIDYRTDGFSVRCCRD